MTATFPISYRGKVYLEEIKIDHQGYDENGNYWGVGDRLYNLYDDDGINDEHFRASDYEEALSMAQEIYPNCKF